MSRILQITDYAVIGCMLAVSASIGIFFRFSGGKQKTINEYLFAGRNMNIAPVAFSLMATFMSAITTLGMPAEVYMYGTQYTMWMMCVPLGGLIAIYGFLPVFYDLGVTTTYEYLEKRFGRTTQSVVSLLFILEMIFYTAIVVFAPAQAIYTITGISTWIIVSLIIVVSTFYCYLGGIKAVMWIDVLQSILMYIPLVAVVIYGSIKIGFTDVFSISNEGGRLIFFNFSFDMTVRYTFWNSVIDGLVFGCKNYGENQAQVQRIMSIGNLKRAQLAAIWSFPLFLLFNSFSFWCGLVIYIVYKTCDPLLNPNVHLSSPDQIMAYFIIQSFGRIPGFTGLCLAGVLSAALSSVSSVMNGLCAVVLEDYIKPYCSCKHLNDSWMSLIAKLLTIGFGSVCLFLVYLVSNFRGVMEATSVLKGFLSGPVLGVYLLAMFTVTANQPGTLIGLTIGMAFSAWIGFGTYLAKVHIPHLPRSTDGCSLSINETTGGYSGTIPTSNITANITVLAEEPNYTFPLYKLSYLWVASTGVAVTFICGYLASLIIRQFIKQPYVNPKYLSPFVRRFHSPNKETENTFQKNKMKIFVKNKTENQVGLSGKPITLITSKVL